jgi:hypothetical protein
MILFEMFSFGFATDNPHNMKLAQNYVATEWTSEQALLSVEYPERFLLYHWNKYI